MRSSAAFLVFLSPQEWGHYPLTDSKAGAQRGQAAEWVTQPGSDQPRLESHSAPSQQVSPCPWYLDELLPLSEPLLPPPFPSGYPASHDSSFQGTDTDSSGAPLLQVYC